LHRSLDIDLFLEWLTLERIAATNFSLHKLGNRTLKPGVMLPVGTQSLEVCFQTAFLWALLVEIALNGVVQQLIDRAPDDLASIFQGYTFFPFDS
jgi:hypothetical protein